MKQGIPTYVWIVIGTLIGLNLATLGIVWLQPKSTPAPSKFEHRPPGPPGPMHGPPAPFDDIGYRLNFSDDQQDQLARLNDAHHQQMREIDRALRSNRNQLFENISLSATDSTAIGTILDRIAQLERKKNYLMWEHLMRIQRLCTDEQRAEFNEVFDRIRMRHGPPHPHP